MLILNIEQCKLNHREKVSCETGSGFNRHAHTTFLWLYLPYKYVNKVQELRDLSKHAAEVALFKVAELNVVRALFG